jgi:chloramphenicol-sensitive protein RarD
MKSQIQRGLPYGLAAYGLWGIIPIYFKKLTEFADSYEILCHRVIWSALLLAIVLTGLFRWKVLAAALSRPRSAGALLASSLLIGANWFIYIYSVETQRVMHSSLGYFVTPLVNVAFGVFLLGERIRRLQGIALAFGAAGLVFLAAQADEFPWISLALAATFSSYGLLRKITEVDAIVGLAIETFLLVPPALWYLAAQGHAWQQTQGGDHFLLILTGPATVLPLFCFVMAARLLPLTYIGFLQYIAPSLQFLVAVFLFGEPLDGRKLAAFSLVWAGLVIFTWDAWKRRAAQRNRLQAAEASEGGEFGQT